MDNILYNGWTKEKCDPETREKAVAKAKELRALIGTLEYYEWHAVNMGRTIDYDKLLKLASAEYDRLTLCKCEPGDVMACPACTFYLSKTELEEIY